MPENQVDLPNPTKSGMTANSLANKISMRKLILSRYILQTIVVFLVFGAIFLAAYHKLIDTAVTGTLLGTAIGSVLKLPYRSNQQKDDNNEKGKNS